MSQSGTGANFDIGPALVNAFQDGLIVRDAEGRIRDVNKAFCEMVGFKAGELIGQLPPHPYWPEEEHARMQASLEEGLAGRASERDFTFRRRDGTLIDVIVSTSPIGEGSDPCGALSIIKDITERKRQQREIARAKESAEAANQAKDQFLAVLSHELRTPLAPVLMALQQMQSHEMSPEVASTAEMIRRNVELEVRLIDDLLDMTRVARGKVQLRFERIDAHRIIASVVEICMPQIRSRQINLHVELGARRHYVFGDSGRLQQVFWNLLSNAMKFTPAGERITIRTFDQDQHLVAEVQDTGIGIEPEALPRVFGMFEQQEGPLSRRFGGLGLGLAICRALVRMHWGQISARSEGPGHGATFTVHLPAQEGSKEESAAPGRLLHHSAAASRRLPEGRRRILIVEDHDDTRFILQRLLERRGYEVEVADSVSAAIRAVLGAPFDFMISDIGLPDGTGLDIMNYIRHRAGDLKLRSIAVSGFGADSDIQRSREAGFEHHLVKPITFDQLVSILEEMEQVHA